MSNVQCVPGPYASSLSMPKYVYHRLTFNIMHSRSWAANPTLLPRTFCMLFSVHSLQLLSRWTTFFPPHWFSVLQFEHYPISRSSARQPANNINIEVIEQISSHYYILKLAIRLFFHVSISSVLPHHVHPIQLCACSVSHFRAQQCAPCPGERLWTFERVPTMDAI